MSIILFLLLCNQINDEDSFNIDIKILLQSANKDVVSRAKLWNDLVQINEWKDITGKYTSKAKYIKDDKNVVTLEKEDGNIINVNLESLSRQNQARISSIHRLYPRIKRDFTLEYDKYQKKIKLENDRNEIIKKRSGNWKVYAKNNILLILTSICPCLPVNVKIVDENGVIRKLEIPITYFGERTSSTNIEYKTIDQIINSLNAMDRKHNTHAISDAISCYSQKNYDVLDNRERQNVIYGLSITKYIPMYGTLLLTGEEVASELNLNLDDRLSAFIPNKEYGDLVFDFVNKNENMPVPRQIINIYKELSQ